MTYRQTDEANTFKEALQPLTKPIGSDARERERWRSKEEASKTVKGGGLRPMRSD